MMCGNSQVFHTSHWKKWKAPVIVLCSVDVFIGIFLGYHFKPSRLARPYFLLEKSGTLRKLCSSIARSIPQLINVLVLLLLHIVLFGFFGSVHVCGWG